MELLASGESADVYRLSEDKVKKVFHEDFLKLYPKAVSSAVQALTLLQNSKHVPRLLDKDSTSVTMSFCGEILTRHNVPNDWKVQTAEICSDLTEANIHYADPSPNNLLVKDGIIYLIDFVFCFKDGMERAYPKNWNVLSTSESLEYIKKIIHGVSSAGKQDIYDYMQTVSTWGPQTLYNELPFPDLKIKYYRKDLTDRITMLKAAYDFKDKIGWDLGSSNGGITFSLQQLGAKITTGVDEDESAIQLASRCELYYHTQARFVHDGIVNFINITKDKVDFCCWFSAFMWVIKSDGLEVAKETLRKISEKSSVLFFDTSLGEGGAGQYMQQHNLTSVDAITKLLMSNTAYSTIKIIGNTSWGDRPVFMLGK
jgi:hypothetical protein